MAHSKWLQNSLIKAGNLPSSRGLGALKGSVDFFAPRRRGFEQNNLEKFKYPGEC